MATGLETADIKGLFNFFQLCGKLKVRIGTPAILFYFMHPPPPPPAAPEADWMGELQGPGARDSDRSHVPYGNVEFPLHEWGQGVWQYPSEWEWR